MKTLHSVFFDLVSISSKQQLISNSVLINKDNTVNSVISNNSNVHELDIYKFKELVLESVAYCICPSFEQQDTFSHSNQKPISMNNYKGNKAEIYNHPEFTDLPKMKDKEYSLVLDMDETLIHFFDVRVIYKY